MTQNKAKTICRFLNRICKECDAWTEFLPVQGSDGQWYPCCLDDIPMYRIQDARDYEQSVLDEAQTGILLGTMEVIPDREYMVIASYW